MQQSTPYLSFRGITMTFPGVKGAFAATGLLFLLTRYAKLGMSPTGLILAGVALSSFFSAISQTLSLQFDLNQELAFWFIGGAPSPTAVLVKATTKFGLKWRLPL